MAREEKISKLLASCGESMSLEIREGINKLVKDFPSVDIFAISIVEAYIWSMHAINDPAYYKEGIKFLTGNAAGNIEGVIKFSRRYGEESFGKSIQSWKLIYDSLKDKIEMIRNCTANELKAFQDHCFNIAEKMARKKQIAHLGAWTFCAPFKIFVIYRKELWSDSSIDQVWMPLGLEVNRGVKKLIRKKYTFVSDLDEGMLSEEEGGLLEGIGTLLQVQDVSMRIAKLACSRIFHINSGFFKLGTGELEL